MKSKPRGLPFFGKTIKFGEICVLNESTSCFAYNAWINCYDLTSQQIPEKTIITPIECVKRGVGGQTLTKCLAGGFGIIYISFISSVCKIT